MGRRNKGRAIDGVLLLNKHLGGSSNQILQQVKRLFFAKKAGHTGALDPLASGMLPICLGEATKFSQYLLDADKTYEVTAKLGIRTTTSDADGEVVEARNVNVSEDELHQALESFRGPIKQVPSMFSALKHEGKPLYYYARQGITIERPARDITIYKLDLTRFENDEVDMVVHCSKGTYIRSLVDDLGQALKCGAYVTRLHRTEVAEYPADKMISMEELESKVEGLDDEAKYQYLDSLLLPSDSPVASLPKIELDSTQMRFVCNGNPVECSHDFIGLVRIFDADQNRFLGVGKAEAGMLHPKRLVVFES